MVVEAGLRAAYGGRSIPAVELGKLGLEAEGTLANDGKHTYAYGAAAAHVAVDPGTGRVEVLEYVTVEDVGRVINPLTAKGQALGAVVQGLGSCSVEHASAVHSFRSKTCVFSPISLGHLLGMCGGQGKAAQRGVARTVRSVSQRSP